MVSSVLNRKKLEDEVEDAIKTGCHINFASKEPKECEYMQKYAEVELAATQDLFAVIILILAIGGGFIPTHLYYGLFILSIGVISYVFLYRRFNDNCSGIILDAKEKLLSEDNVEPNQPQETTTTPPQAQENTLSKGQSIAQIESIKAWLGLLKIVISAVVVAMLGLGAYNLQSQRPDVTTVSIAIILLGVPLFISVWQYHKSMNKLKEL